MKRKKLLIVVGHGSHSTVVAEAARLMGYDVIKIIDFRNKKNLKSVKKNKRKLNFIVAIGDNHLRQKVFQYLKKNSMPVVKIIHPKAIVSKGAKIKKGTFVAAGVTVSTNVFISENTIVNTGAIIDHHSKIGQHSHIGPGVKIAGNVTVGQLCFIGLGSSVIESIKIANRTTVGAGAVVINNLASNLTYVGVPATKIISSKEGKILFLGRKNCKYSKKIYFLIRKINKNVKFLISDLNNKRKIKRAISKIRKDEFDYLISFRSYLIIDKKTLDKIKIASINFHPGPPEYRGIGCANFALINEERKFGCSCHIMNEKIDKGKFLDVRYFSLKKNIDINSLLSKTHKVLYGQSKEIISAILTNKSSIDSFIKRNKEIKWSRKIYTRKNLDNLYHINSNIKKNKLNKLLRACNTKVYKPYITMHGKKFFYFKNNKKSHSQYIKFHDKKFFYINK